MIIRIVMLFIIGLFSFGNIMAQEKYEIDYEKIILLDAENLAEMGIKNAYEKLKPELKKYVKTILEIEEIKNKENTKYSIKYKNKEYLIYDESNKKLENSWVLATYAFFDIINDQLKNTDIKFYALNSGNDLFGIFLTKTQAEGSKKALNNRSDWPYMPTKEKPKYGMY